MPSLPALRLVAAGAVLLLSTASAGSAERLGAERWPAGGEPAAQPRRVDPFDLRLQTTVRGGLAVGATCLNYQEPAEGGPNGGLITIDSLPAGATVLHAWLYWTVLHSGSEVPMGTPTFDGVPIPFDRLGVVPFTPCFSPGSSGFFRSDVTSLVAGNGTYTLAGFPGVGNGIMPLAEGATLFVVWCEPSAPLTDIVLLDGAETLTLTDEPFFSQTLTGFRADPSAPPIATLALAAGNGQLAEFPEDGADELRFNGVDLDELHPEILSGNACPRGFYDLTLLDVSEYLSPGDTSAEVLLQVSVDCYTVAAVALAVSADPAGQAEACEDAGCGGALDLPVVPIACSGEEVELDLSAVLRDCPAAAGDAQLATQAVDPLVSMDTFLETELQPAFTLPAAATATLAFDLAGRTDVELCTEVELIDPTGFPHLVKPVGAPAASPYDARGWYVGPGTYRLRLWEFADCGSDVNGDAVLSAASLSVEAFPSPSGELEYRVEDAAGTAVCDWSPSPACRFLPASCPGIETYTALVRCAEDPSCLAGRRFELSCSGLQADFTADAPCGSSEVCFSSEWSDGIGPVEASWDFAGEGASAEPSPCFEFTGPPPWTVTLTGVDESGCPAVVEREVAPDPAPAPLEPSALDLDAFREPLRVSREGADLRLEWEDLGPEHTYHAYRGELGRWYSHEAFGWCDRSEPLAMPALEPGDHYFVVAGVGCDGSESSVGRDSGGLERPPAESAVACP